MRRLYKEEMAAVWLYHERYAAQRLGAIEFYKKLYDYEKSTIARMVSDIGDLSSMPKKKKSAIPKKGKP